MKHYYAGVWQKGYCVCVFEDILVPFLINRYLDELVHSSDYLQVYQRHWHILCKMSTPVSQSAVGISSTVLTHPRDLWCFSLINAATTVNHITHTRSIFSFGLLLVLLLPVLKLRVKRLFFCMHLSHFVLVWMRFNILIYSIHVVIFILFTAQFYAYTQ